MNQGINPSKRLWDLAKHIALDDMEEITTETVRKRLKAKRAEAIGKALSSQQQVQDCLEELSELEEFEDLLWDREARLNAAKTQKITESQR